MVTEFDTSSLSGEPDFYAAYPYHWHVIHCKSGREKLTVEALRSNLGLIVYLPEKKIWKKGIASYIPLFPGYFFIQADLGRTAPSQINTSPGVLRLLAFDGIPQTVPSDFIKSLYAEVASMNTYSSTPHLAFRPGDTLHVIDGPLRGLETIFVSAAAPGKRAQVLLNFLGRLTKAEIDGNVLEKRVESANPKRVRYTRGKGRKIRRKEAI